MAGLVVSKIDNENGQQFLYDKQTKTTFYG